MQSKNIHITVLLLFTQSDKTVDAFISIYSIYLNANLIITHSGLQSHI